MFLSGERHVSRTGRARLPLFGRRRAHGGVVSHDAQSETTHNTRIVTVAGPVSNEAVAPPGRGGGKLPPMSGRPKNYVICVCFHCHGTSSYHTTNTLQGRRAKSHVLYTDNAAGTGGLRTLDPL